MQKNILEIQNLTKYYENVKAVENLSLTLKEGEIFGFIGPNGAGKSTTIRSILNLINKTSGKVLINGKELTKDNTKLKEIIGYLPSEINLYEDFTVKEMLDYHEKFYKINIHKKRIELSQKFKIDENKKIEDLSLGNLKKLGIILALMHEPKILILDEPTSGLDPIMQNIFFDILKEEKIKGTTIFYSTHILNEVSKICDRIGIIKEGKLIKIEETKTLSKKNFLFITIESNQCEQIQKELKIKPISKQGEILYFSYKKDIDKLIKQLANYNIKKLLIKEPTLEDLFLHYYN